MAIRLGEPKVAVSLGEPKVVVRLGRLGVWVIQNMAVRLGILYEPKVAVRLGEPKVAVRLGVYISQAMAVRWMFDLAKSRCPFVCKCEPKACCSFGCLCELSGFL